TEGLPTDEYARVVREDPKKKGHLYLGSERQVWHSPDGGNAWHPLKLNMPTVAISDLVVKDDDLVVGTQGRSIWILDDLTPVREWSKPIGNKAVHVFTPLAGVRWGRHGPVTDHQTVAAGKNPPPGLLITYFLKDKAKKPLVVEVLNEKNERIVRLEGKDKDVEDEDEDEDDEEEGEGKEDPRRPEIPGNKGMNRFAWDLRHQGAEGIKKAKLDAGDPRRGAWGAGGRYGVRAGADGKSFRVRGGVGRARRGREPGGLANLRKPPQKIEIMPRVAGADDEARLAKAPWIMRRNNLDVVRDEAREQEQFALRLRNDLTRLTGIVNDLRVILKQLKLHEDLLA